MLKAQLWATSDLQAAIQSTANGFKVVYVGDPISMDPAYKNMFVAASSLIPDYQAMVYKIDGNEKAFVDMYLASLNSKPALEMLSVIFACLYKGTNIMFYFPKESLDLNYTDYLFDYIKFNWGIIAQTQSSMFAFDVKFSGKIIELLYLYNLVTPNEFLIYSETLNDMTIKKLVRDVHPMVEDPTNLDSIITWFSNFKDQLLSSQTHLVNGIQYAGEESDYVCY